MDAIHKEAMDEMKAIGEENEQKLHAYKERLRVKKDQYIARLHEFSESMDNLDDHEVVEFILKEEKQFKAFQPEEEMPVTRKFDKSKYEDKFLALKDRLAKEFDTFNVDKKKKKRKSKS